MQEWKNMYLTNINQKKVGIPLPIWSKAYCKGTRIITNKDTVK